MKSDNELEIDFEVSQTQDGPRISAKDQLRRSAPFPSCDPAGDGESASPPAAADLLSSSSSSSRPSLLALLHTPLMP